MYHTNLEDYVLCALCAIHMHQEMFGDKTCPLYIVTGTIVADLCTPYDHFRLHNGLYDTSS